MYIPTPVFMFLSRHHKNLGNCTEQVPSTADAVSCSALHNPKISQVPRKKHANE
jgi:hypothetical protein